MLYHATPTENVDVIESEGLIAGSLNQPIYPGMYGAPDGVYEGVYVTSSLEDAEIYADWLTTEKQLGDDAEMAIFAIDASRFDDDVYPDPEGDMMGDAISASGMILADDVPASKLDRER